MVDTFKNLTDEKIEHIIQLPYKLLAKQIEKEYGVDVVVNAQVRKKENIEIL